MSMAETNCIQLLYVFSANENKRTYGMSFIFFLMGLVPKATKIYNLNHPNLV